MARPRLRLIVNPVASGVKERTVRAACRRSRRAATSSWSRRSTAGTRPSSPPRRSRAGFDGVVAMGGDGTANEVLNGAGDALPIGVLPAGGTSVLPRALGMPRSMARAALRSPTRSSPVASG